jgi:hypothetical protein
MKLFASLCFFILFAGSVTGHSWAQEAGPRSVWNIEERGAFVVASHYDGKRFYWFGTEDKGVWRYDPKASEARAWRAFTVKDGLGDDHGYALATDHQGRLWVGHQNHGVSVWNGRAWKNYGVLDGPLGERVFDIAVSPLNGEVWIAGSRGIARYDVEKKEWSYEGRISGLPSDQIQSLAFSKDGTVFVGTQCDGLAIGSPKDGYTEWRVEKGPGYMPLYATGPGLPSDVINDVFVGSDDTVYVATGYGLARSLDNGASWVYLRGKDWKEKLKGLTFPPAILDQPERDVLTEDYVTTIAEDAAGNIWLGHPSKGVEVRSAGADVLGVGGVVQTPDEEKVQERQEKFEREMEEALERGEVPKVTRDRQGRITAIVPPVEVPKLGQSEKTDYVTSILPIEGEAPLVCGYGSGVIQLGGQLATFPRQDEMGEGDGVTTVAALPLRAPAPSLAQLKALLGQVQELKTLLNLPGAAVLNEDWNTKGDWVGRYGTRYALLCSMGAPLDHRIINDNNYHVEGRLGLHPYVKGEKYKDQGLRHWVHRARWDDQRVLYNPLIGYRRQADSDDNGEVYPMSYEGPDIWMGVRIPEGTHRVALYFFNKDGHEGHNRVRDYLIDVKRGHENLLVAEEFPTLARTRVRDFWGGVHKSFLLQGPGDYYFVMRKNNSFNTIVQSVKIDKLNGPPTSHEARRDVWLGGVRYEPPTSEALASYRIAALNAVAPEHKERLRGAIDLWKALDDSYDRAGIEVLQGPLRVLCYRTVQETVGDKEAGVTLLQSWRWTLPLWPEEDRKEFEETMKNAWDTLLKKNPKLRPAK